MELVPELGDVDRLDDHQLRNVVAMTHSAGVGIAVFDEQGTGKTITALYALDVLFARDELGLAFIVAPKSMVGEWPMEVERFRSGAYAIAVLSGNRAEKRRILRRGADIVVCNFETIVSLEQEVIVCARGYDGRCALVVDESFFIKNADAKRSRALRRAREWFGRCYVLCGTPAPNSAVDVVSQIDLVDFGATFADLEVPEDRETAHAAVARRLRERGSYLRSLKDEVLPGLPARSVEIGRIPLAPQQAEAYRHAVDALVLDLTRETDAGFARRLESYAARRSALLQICSNPSRVVPGYAETPAKLRALDELVKDLVLARGEKLVVWSFYTASLTAIEDRYKELGLVRYDGSVAEVGARRDAVHRFQHDPATRLFLGNPAAAGAGLTLHAARYAVYESFSNQAAHFLQSLDRVHRRGQTRDVTYLVLLAAGTIEEPEFARLTAKQREAGDLLGDRAKVPPTRNEMLRELETNALV